MSSGIAEDNVQFQSFPTQLDPKEPDIRTNLLKLNMAVASIQEYLTQLRNRVIELEEKVLN